MRVVPARLVALTLLAATSGASANDLHVAVTNGGLVVKGDADDNVVALDGDGLGADAVRLTPGGATTVNGSAAAQVFTGLAAGGVTITLGGGNDAVSILHFNPTGKIAIVGGAGADRITVTESTMHGPTKLDLGAGDNALGLCSATFEGTLTLKSGKGSGGAASIDCGNVANQWSTTDGTAVLVENGATNDLVVKLGAGNDAFALVGSTVHGAVKATFGGGSDGVVVCGTLIDADVSLALGGSSASAQHVVCATMEGTADATGQSAVAIGNTPIGGSLVVTGGAGDDVVALAGEGITGDVTAKLGAGNNVLRGNSVTFSKGWTTKTGKGADLVDFNDFLVTGVAKLLLGDGDNQILFATTLFQDDLTIKTGKGDDVIHAQTTTFAHTSIDPGPGTNDVQIP